MKRNTTVFWFTLLTVALSFAAYFLPLPSESRALLVPVLLVFIPAIVCVSLVLITEGRDGLRQLFSSSKSGIQWLLIGMVVGAGMRVAVLIGGTLFGIPVKADLSGPGTLFIILATIPLAYFEELGWRRFALDRLLKSRSLIESAVLLGLPWSVIHLVVILPGMMSVGSPAIPQTIVLICLGIVISWGYVHSGGSVFTATLIHGVQNGLVILNRGLTNAEATWLMMWVYLMLAVVLVVVERRLFFAKPSSD